MQMTLKEWLILIFLSLIWGGSFYFNEIAVREVSPLVTVWGRVGGAALILLLIMKFQGIGLPRDAKLWKALLLIGVLNNALPFLLIVWAQTHITSSLASILNATTPLFAIVMAHFMTMDEKITKLKIAGLLIGFIGVVVMIGYDALQGLSGNVVAQCVMLVSSASYSLSAIYGRRYLKGVNTTLAATGQAICAAAVLLPPMLLFGFPHGYALPSADTLLAIFGLAFLCTAIAYMLYFRLLASAGAVNMMLVTFLVPVSAITLGIFLLGEQLTLEEIIGMVMILVGLMLIDGRLFRGRST